LGRPGYPPEAVRWLAERTALGPDSTVVDLGAGTGNFTRVLAATGANVVAVEPLAAMRRRFPSDVHAEVVDGSAEEISLPDNSADLVTVAEAFHWFQGDEALREIHRVLRPGGSLALVWNRLDLTNAFEAAFHALLERSRGHPPVRDAGSWRQAFQRTLLFAPPEVRRFANTQELDADALVHRAASESAIAILPEHRRGSVLAEVRALGRSRPEPIILRYVTEVYLYERLAEYKSTPLPGTFTPSRRKETR
jgi:SAM-dependent methyltransferase